MNKDQFLKIQTCVLKVNIHCDGCKQKVKKILQKIDGVYTIKIDSEQGKVTVSGNVDPATLIKKLIKNGKHAEIWGGSKPHNNFQNQLNNQFKNLQIDYGKGGNNKGNIIQKGGGDKPKGAGQDQLQLLQAQLQQMKGFQDLKALPLNKDHNQKSAKLNLPKDEDLSDDEFDDDDDYDDDDDDYDDDEYDESDDEVEDTPLNKAKPVGGNGHGGSFMSNLLMNSQNLVKGGGNNGGNGGGNAKKGSGGENGGGANGGKKDGNQSQGGGKGGKGGGAQPQDSKNGGGGGQNNKNGNHGGSGATNGKSFMPNGLIMPNGAKKSGGMNDETHGMPNMMTMNMPIGQMGNIPTHPIGNLPAVQGLPALNATSGGRGYFNGGGPEHVAGNHPYYQQQLAAMMMNQQRANGNESFQPMMYSRPPPAVNYMPSYLPYPYPPPPGERIDQYSMFSDENASGCTVM